MTTEIRSAIDFYERHPISAGIIVAKVKAARGSLDNVSPEDLFAHDQDHYGGLAANDALAALARSAKAHVSPISAPASAVRRAISRTAMAPMSPASS